MKPKLKATPVPRKRQTPAPKNPALQRHGNDNRKGKANLDRTPRQDKRRTIVEGERKERDIGEFVQAIQQAAEDLDFALRMYAVELEAQLFTQTEIAAKTREVFRQAAVKIITKAED